MRARSSCPSAPGRRPEILPATTLGPATPGIPLLPASTGQRGGGLLDAINLDVVSLGANRREPPRIWGITLRDRRPRGPFTWRRHRPRAVLRRTPLGRRRTARPNIHSTQMEPTRTASWRGRERPPIALESRGAAGARYDLSRGSLPPSPDPRHSCCPGGQRVRVGRGWTKSGRKLRGLDPDIGEQPGDSRGGGRGAGRGDESDSVSASVSRRRAVRARSDDAIRRP
jgi:hypothetical protein